MARSILKLERNAEFPEFDKKSESKNSSTLDLKPKSVLQFIGTEKKITPFELKMVENYIVKAVFCKYKYDFKKFQFFIDDFLKSLKEICLKPEEDVPRPIDLEFLVEEFIYKNLAILKKAAIMEAIRKNGLLSFIMIIIQNKLEKENLLQNFQGKHIRYNQKIIFCSNEHQGCNYKGKFADFLIHEKTDCQFEKICCPFMNCKEKQLRNNMRIHERACPFKVI